MTGYANWKSGEVESLVFVGSTPTSVTGMIPWSNGKDAWVTTRKAVVRLHPGSLARKRSVGVLAAHLLGKEEDRVRLPDGPLEMRAAGPRGRRLVCTQAIGVRFPGGPLNVYGLVVQRDDTALAWRKSGFDSRRVHWITEGSRIRLAGPHC